MNKRQVLGMAMAGIVGAFAVAAPAQAEAINCTRVGTWFGEAADAGLKWLGNHTQGTSATTGQLSFEWVQVDPSYGGQFPALRLTSGEGVWAKVNQTTYKYTWFAYGLRPVATGYPPPMPASIMVPIYALKVTGTGVKTSCDETQITYTAEFLSPDLTTTYHTASGTATEKRMLLTAAP